LFEIFPLFSAGYDARHGECHQVVLFVSRINQKKDKEIFGTTD